MVSVTRAIVSLFDMVEISVNKQCACRVRVGWCKFVNWFIILDIGFNGGPTQ